jgi:hypothetical protein
MRSLAATRGAAFRIGGLATAALLAASVAGIFASRTTSDTDRTASQLESYDTPDYQPPYRAGSCFAPVNNVLDDVCLALVPGKINVLLWGDSFAAHYYPGLARAIDPQKVNILQATRPACMPTFDVAPEGLAYCRNAATEMDAFYRNHRPDVVILSADWLEDARPPRFDGMIADIQRTIARLNTSGISVVLLGPPVQFMSRLPPMLVRAHLRQIDPRPDDFVLPGIFMLDQKMKAALPAHEKFSYVSVVDAVCPERQCPITIDGGIPLAWDHAHLTEEGSVYVMGKLLPLLGLPK